MVSVPQLIKQISSSKGIHQDIIQKDYALSYLLTAITEMDEFHENLVLKGGTALRKLYFQDYRFSEDLDFSTRFPGPINQCDGLMQDAINNMLISLNKKGPFQAFLQPLALNLPHPSGQEAYIVRIQFPEQRQPLCRLKIEITIDEPILTSIVPRPLYHGFDETLTSQIPGYSLVEITTEKLRALLQSHKRLKERGWGASRVCRDYYDIWHLLQHPDVSSANLIPLLQEKCTVRNVSFSSPEDFVTEELLNVARKEWRQQLLPFVTDTPSVSELLPEVQAMIYALWE